MKSHLDFTTQIPILALLTCSLGVYADTTTSTNEPITGSDGTVTMTRYMMSTATFVVNNCAAPPSSQTLASNTLYYNTITITSGSTAGTITIDAASGTHTGTIQIIRPTPNYVTTTSTAAGTALTTITTTLTTATADGQIGLVEIIVPHQSTVTTTRTTYVQVGQSAYTSTESTAGYTVTIDRATPLHETTTTITSGSQSVATTTLYKASGTVTGTVQVIQPTPQSCNNAGLQYAIYNNAFTDRGTQYAGVGNYQTFNPQYFKTQRPYANDLTNTLGFLNNIPGSNVNGVYQYDTNITVYKTSTKTISVAVNHRGYFFPKMDGNYTFSSPSTDDMTIMWIGSLAYSGWTRANAQIVQGYVNTQNNAMSYSMFLNAGQYYPIRFMFGNDAQVASFQFLIKAPDGSTVVSNISTTANQYLVPYSCDLTTAPMFQPWGQET